MTIKASTNIVFVWFMCEIFSSEQSAYIEQQLVSLERVKLQVAWFPVQHQGFAAWINHQV